MSLFDSKILDKLLPGGSRIPVGFHENVKVLSMEIGTTPKGKEYIEFQYENQEGQKANNRI